MTTLLQLYEDYFQYLMWSCNIFVMSSVKVLNDPIWNYIYIYIYIYRVTRISIEYMLFSVRSLVYVRHFAWYLVSNIS